MSEKKTTEFKPNYWWLSAVPAMWNVADFKVGQAQEYTLLNEKGNKRYIYKNFLEVKVGDLVIGYQARNPYQQIVALCEITREQDGETIQFKKIENFANPIKLSEFKDAPELRDMQFLKARGGSLFKVEKNEFDYLMKLIRKMNPAAEASSEESDDMGGTAVEESELEDPINENPVSENPIAEKNDTGKSIYTAYNYDKDQFRREVFMSGYNELVELLKDKKNVILQGAPGVGKTYIARRIAYLMMKEMNDDRIAFVQFHQSYSYEDFVYGYKPSGNSFEPKPGIFYQFCKTAQEQPDKEFFFIIDEINRGNMSKIFGELLSLIEKDYRGTEVKLEFEGMPFSVPENIYIIGLMNTADRSLAVIDYALRRRFSFFEIEPGFDSDGFQTYEDGLGNDMFKKLIDTIKSLNNEIKNDDSLGKGFRIGHSYFCGWDENSCTKERMLRVVKYDILPTLEEYWFDDNNKYEYWKNTLINVVEGDAG